MANEQTSVPLYAASEILTAANMNISAGTGVPVFATTVTRDAAFGGANEKVLAEGQLCYLSATNVVQYYDGAAWATVGPAAAATSGLTLVNTITVTAAATTNINNCFTSTYKNYLITSNLTSSANTAFNIRLRAAGADNTNANYNIAYYFAGITGTNFSNASSFAATSFNMHVSANNLAMNMYMLVANPQATAKTTLAYNNIVEDFTASSFFTFAGGGAFTPTTSFDGFSVLSGGAATFTGTINIYGLAIV